MVFLPNLCVCSENNPQNINYMPAVIFLACLDLDQKSSFLDGYYLMASISEGEANLFIFHRWVPVLSL